MFTYSCCFILFFNLVYIHQDIPGISSQTSAPLETHSLFQFSSVLQRRLCVSPEFRLLLGICRMLALPQRWPWYPAWIRSKRIHILPWLLNLLQQCLCMASICFPVLRTILGSCLIRLLCSFLWHGTRWRDPRERNKDDLPLSWELPIWWVTSQQSLSLLLAHCHVSSLLSLSWPDDQQFCGLQYYCCDLNNSQEYVVLSPGVNAQGCSLWSMRR